MEELIVQLASGIGAGGVGVVTGFVVSKWMSKRNGSVGQFPSSDPVTAADIEALRHSVEQHRVDETAARGSITAALSTMAESIKISTRDQTEALKSLAEQLRRCEEVQRESLASARLQVDAQHQTALILQNLLAKGH